MDGLKAIVLQHRGLAGADTFLMVNLEMYHGVDPTFGTKFNRLLSEQKRRFVVFPVPSLFPFPLVLV